MLVIYYKLWKSLGFLKKRKITVRYDFKVKKFKMVDSAYVFASSPLKLIKMAVKKTHEEVYS